MTEKETLIKELDSENYGLYSVCSWLVNYHSGLIPPNHVFEREEVLEDLYKKFFPIRQSTLTKIYDLWNSSETNYIEDIKSIILSDGDYEKRYGIKNYTKKNKMIKLVKIYDEYHLVDTDAPIEAEKDLCLNYIACAMARFKGLDYNRLSLSISRPFSADKKTNLFEGIDKAIATTMVLNFDNLFVLNKEQIEKLLGKTDKALDYVNKYYEYKTPFTLDELGGEQLAIYKAYKQAEEDNAKNIFTIEDMETCFDKARERTQHPDWDMIYDDFQDFCDKTISNVDGQIMEWEAEIKTTHVSPDKSSQTQFKPYDSIEILSLTPIKY